MEIEPKNEQDAALQIARIFELVAPGRRGLVLRNAMRALEPKKVTPTSASRSSCPHCEFCGRAYAKKSTNQRYCSFRCSKEAGAMKRLEASAQRVDARFG